MKIELLYNALDKSQDIMRKLVKKNQYQALSETHCFFLT